MSVESINHIFRSLEKHFTSATPTSAATVCKSLSQDKNEAPTAGIGTADAGTPYPVTCRARYYDAASKVLEDELRLFSHENANELGAVIEQWIERKRENLDPR
jgi:hypothetical protein